MEVEKQFLLYLWGTDYGLGKKSYVSRYNAGVSASHKFYSGATNTATIDSSGTITATTFSGSGASLTNIPCANITGNLRKTYQFSKWLEFNYYK